ncbi:MAG: hypothetical protein FJX99_09250, partial [Bacteroidetes bacterium]|nr:hypothetical protein [Bacteroidota bacterium]
MKNTSNILALALTIFTFTSVFTSMAQQGKIWAVVQSSALPVYVNNQLVSTDAAFNQAISNLNINSVEKALPASKNQNLQNVYEIT